VSITVRALIVTSVVKKYSSRCVPVRSRTKTQRTGISGRPLRYHQPLPVTTSTRRRPPPYHATDHTGRSAVARTTSAGSGSSFPFLQGRWAGRLPGTGGGGSNRLAWG